MWRRAIRSQITRASDFVTGDRFGAFLIRSVIGNGAVRLTGMVASFAVGVQLARGLGVESFGYFSIALAIITIAGIPGELGLSYLVTRDVAAAASLHQDSRVVRVFRSARTLCTRLSLATMAGVLAISVALFLVGSRTLALALIVGAPMIIFIALARVGTGALAGLNHVVRGQIPVGVIRPMALSLLLGLATMLSWRLNAVGAMALATVAAACVLFVTHIWLRKRLPAALPTKRATNAWALLGSSFPMGLMEGMRILQAELTIVLVGAVTSPAIAGMLRVANVTAMTAAMILVIVVQVVLPVMARLHAQGDHQRLQKTVTAVAHAQFAGVVVIAVPLMIAATPLLSLAFGESFAPAADALRLLLLGQILNAALGPNIWLLNMTGHERHVARALAMGVAANVLSIPLLALKWGLEGGAVGLVASMFLWNVLSWRDARRLLQIETSILHWPWRRSESAP